MRGDLLDNEGMFSYLTPAQRVPKDHALRPIRLLVDEVPIEPSPVFQRMYARTGRPSIPPERLIRALVLMMLYSTRGERQLMGINFNILFPTSRRTTRGGRARSTAEPLSMPATGSARDSAGARPDLDTSCFYSFGDEK
jgi:transposase-like protein DUF772